MSGRLLVVSFHFPPAPGVAAQRVGALARELRGLGWEVGVVAGPAAGGDGDADRVAPRPGLPRIQGADWAAAARSRVLEHARDADVALLSGGPFAPFLLGPVLRRRGVPYVLDFRDPWSWEPRFGRFRPGLRRRAGRAVERLGERCAVAGAAAIITVAPEISEAYARLYPKSRDTIRTIRHGFDPADFVEPVDVESEPVLLHAGTMLAGDRSPALVVETARRVRARGTPLRVVLLGPFSPELEPLVAEPERDGWLERRGPVSHRDAIEAMRRASVLWLQPGELPFLGTGKVYEYLAARRPIVAAVGEGAAAALLRETGGALVVPTEPAAAADAVEVALAGGVAPVDERALAALAQPVIAQELDEILEAVIR